MVRDDIAPPSSSLKVMGILPEKHALHREVLTGLHNQFHSQACQSSQALDASALRAPGSLAPLPLTSPSGLSRTQFLVVAQAATLPCFPSTCKSDGGLVLDRVLVQGGKGEQFWAALTGRAKVQRILAKRKHYGWKRAMGDPENYVLGANARLRARPGTNIKLSAELQPRSTSATGGSEATGHSSTPASTVQGMSMLKGSTVRARTQLQHRLKHAELRASLACNQRLQHSTGCSTVPLTSSIDICTPHQQATPLQFRAGVYHATAPSGLLATEGGSSQQLRSSIHMQGCLALQGERNLWSGNPAARRVRLYKQQQQSQQQQQRKPSYSALLADAHSSGGPHNATAHSAASTSSPAGHASGSNNNAVHVDDEDGAGHSGREAARPRSNTLGPHNPIRQYLQRLLPHHHAGSGFGEEEEEEQGDDRGRWGTSLRERRGGGRGVRDLGWLIPDADQVQESVIDATQSTNRLREDVQSLTDWVSSGAFGEQLQRRMGPVTPSKTGKPAHLATRDTSPASSSSSANQPPWSSLVGPPHFRIAGIFGTGVMAPLSSSSGSALNGEGPLASSPGQPSLEALKSTLTLAKQEISMRPFATAGASLQLGWFQRPAFDYTRLLAKLDLGVPGSAQQAGSPRMHPAFGLEGQSVWHALTLSLRQQLMGPLRFCADLRYSLDSKQAWRSKPSPALPPPQPVHSTGPIPHPGQQSNPANPRKGNHAADSAQKLARHVGSMRLSLLESSYGLDLVLPGTSGFGRLVAWYVPARKEGMLELRLF